VEYRLVVVDAFDPLDHDAITDSPKVSGRSANASCVATRSLLRRCFVATGLSAQSVAGASAGLVGPRASIDAAPPRRDDRAARSGWTTPRAVFFAASSRHSPSRGDAPPGAQARRRATCSR